MTRQVRLTIALGAYGHTLDLISGAVPIAGTRPTFVAPGLDDPLRRFADESEWDVSEVSLMHYAMRRAAGDDDIIAIPVFTSRMFCHGAIYVRRAGIDAPSRLRGRRIGIPRWDDAVGVCARGLLGDMYGLAPDEMEWWEAGVGRSRATGSVDEPVVPSGVTRHESGARGLIAMLREDELDALIITAPDGPVDDAEMGHLFPEDGSAERAYYRQTGCLPLMNVVTARRELLERYPWLATNLYRAFEVAKRRYFARLIEISASRTPIPWPALYLKRARALFGDDLWPYGIDDNRRSLETCLRYGTEQGLFARPPSVDDLFAPVESFVANEQ